jgi:hypothetical protein
MPRRFPIFQLPNPPLITAILAAAFARTTHGLRSHKATQLSRLSLLVWSAEELATGANWFRRSLGIVCAAYTLGALVGLSATQTNEGGRDGSCQYTTSE